MKFLAATILLLTCTVSVWAEGPVLERFALIAGSNQGGKTTKPLKYAVNDAKKVQDILTRIGGVKEENTLLLLNPEKQSLNNALAFFKSKIARQTGDSQPQFVFYYSGHSDEEGLLLFGEKFSYSELKAALAQIGSAIQIVILDSCASGAFTRTKGGSFTAPFLEDTATDVEGHAYLTSSTAEEVSQEADQIEGSFFTHALVSGLKGAADSNADGKVTLNEAYEFAFNETLAGTENTSAGAQHPAFDIKLNGQGNLVLTDLRQGESFLSFDRALKGKLSLRDITNKLILEVTKVADRTLDISVGQGYYRINLDDKKDFFELNLLVDEKKSYPVGVESFSKVKKVRTANRGSFNWAGGTEDVIDGPMVSLLYNTVKEDSQGLQISPAYNHAGANYAGFQGALGGNLVKKDFEGYQAALLFNFTGGTLAGLQTALFNRVEGDTTVGQVGLFNFSGGVGGDFQFGLVNQAEKGNRGFQAGSLNFTGAQGAVCQVGGFNSSQGPLAAGQYGGVVNLSQNGLAGVQAGLLNLGQTVTGLQIGLINYSEKHNGLQVGLINISQNLEGLPLGLIDIQMNGENHLDVLWMPDLANGTATSGLASVGFRLGSKYFYKFLAIGGRAFATSTGAVQPPLNLTAGLGLRLPIGVPDLALCLDAGASYFNRDYDIDLTTDPAFLKRIVPQARLFASYHLLGNVGLLAGFNDWIFTKNFHVDFKDGGQWQIRTPWAILCNDLRFFVGVAL